MQQHMLYVVFSKEFLYKFFFVFLLVMIWLNILIIIHVQIDNGKVQWNREKSLDLSKKFQQQQQQRNGSFTKFNFSDKTM